MNVFQRIDALQSLQDAHAAGTISNDNLRQGTESVCALFDAQPEDAQVTPYSGNPRFIASAAEQMVITSANTHELKEGDVLAHYGRYLQLSNRKTWPMRKDDCPERQGECVTFDTTEVGQQEHPQLPQHWVKGFTIQGNKMATWAVITAA